jgi:hypothetical protein
MSKRTPQNKVGHKSVSPAEASAMQDALFFLRTKAAEYGPPLQKSDAKRLTIVRTGYEAQAELILRLAERFQIQGAGGSVAEVRADMSLVEQLTPVYQDAALTAGLFRGVIRQARAEAWDGIMALYDVLKALAKTKPELEAALRPMVDFMARESRPVEDDKIGGDE